MGTVKGVSATEWPTQGEGLHQRCAVIFNYGGEALHGTVVRDDVGQPFETIIRLDDGRYVRGVECQYRPLGTREGR